MNLKRTGRRCGSWTLLLAGYGAFLLMGSLALRGSVLQVVVLLTFMAVVAVFGVVGRTLRQDRRVNAAGEAWMQASQEAALARAARRDADRVQS